MFSLILEVFFRILSKTRRSRPFIFGYL